VQARGFKENVEDITLSGKITSIPDLEDAHMFLYHNPFIGAVSKEASENREKAILSRIRIKFGNSSEFSIDMVDYDRLESDWGGRVYHGKIGKKPNKSIQPTANAAAD
jgi:hypothetical protein